MIWRWPLPGGVAKVTTTVLRRRSFLLGFLGGVSGALAACARNQPAPRRVVAMPPQRMAPPRVGFMATPAPVPALPPIPPPHPGRPTIVSHASPSGGSVALTIDDGYSPEAVDAYVAFAARSGICIIFSPNGINHRIWERHTKRLRPLIATGQVQIGNHTWSHPDLRALSDVAVREEIERNEQWIQETFGITSRPWFRPPFGFHDQRIDELAASLGFTRILMWNGTFGDATPISPGELLDLARRWLHPGTIMLGHANHPTITHLFGQVQQLLAARRLHPNTLDQLFGTTRATG
jgi:peptidoglycan-N-acetylglucosamine deacetylase